MAILDCFKSNRELEAERRREKRRNERKVEQDIASFDDKMDELKRRRDAEWKQARELLKSGRRAEAQRQLLYYKKYDVLLMNLEKQKAFLTGQAIRIRFSGDAAATLADICRLASGMGIDPDALDENLNEMELISQDVIDSDKLLNKAFDRDIADMEKAEADSSIQYKDDELMAALENECVAEIDGESVSAEANAEQAGKEGLDAGAERLRKLLGGK